MAEPAGLPSWPLDAWRLAVLISGRGSNLEALLREFPPHPPRPAHAAPPEQPEQPQQPAISIKLVIANRPDAAGLNFARAAGVASQIIDHHAFPNRAEFDAALDATLRRHEINLVCLAGFMRLLTPEFVRAWQDRLINIHPALLPHYKGLHTHRRVLAAGERETGCTVHFVRPAMDEGPIIAQSRVAILPHDSEDSLAARVLAAEHRLYPLAVRQICGINRGD
ncbi:MAG: phosphoribosylglycinamide formyltransferase [Candidatus Symbiobacter sp.]|nr:phosphoribosylglycinamide formyltransferase [Candidatus Symbiobacter sp.]